MKITDFWGKKENRIAVIVAASVLGVTIVGGVGYTVFSKNKPGLGTHVRTITASDRNGDVDYRRAIASLEEQISADPRSQEPYVEIARLYADNGEFDQAREAIEEGLANADETEALTELAGTIDALESQAATEQTHNETAPSTQATAAQTEGTTAATSTATSAATSAETSAESSEETPPPSAPSSESSEPSSQPSASSASESSSEPSAEPSASSSQESEPSDTSEASQSSESSEPSEPSGSSESSEPSEGSGEDQPDGRVPEGSPVYEFDEAVAQALDENDAIKVFINSELVPQDGYAPIGYTVYEPEELPDLTGFATYYAGDLSSSGNTQFLTASIAETGSGRLMLQAVVYTLHEGKIYREGGAGFYILDPEEPKDVMMDIIEGDDGYILNVSIGDQESAYVLDGSFDEATDMPDISGENVTHFFAMSFAPDQFGLTQPYETVLVKVWDDPFVLGNYESRTTSIYVESSYDADGFETITLSAASASRYPELARVLEDWEWEEGSCRDIRITRADASALSFEIIYGITAYDVQHEFHNLDPYTGEELTLDDVLLMPVWEYEGAAGPDDYDESACEFILTPKGIIDYDFLEGLYSGPYDPEYVAERYCAVNSDIVSEALTMPGRDYVIQVEDDVVEIMTIKDEYGIIGGFTLIGPADMPDDGIVSEELEDTGSVDVLYAETADGEFIYILTHPLGEDDAPGTLYTIPLTEQEPASGDDGQGETLFYNPVPVSDELSVSVFSPCPEYMLGCRSINEDLVRCGLIEGMKIGEHGAIVFDQSGFAVTAGDHAFTMQPLTGFDFITGEEIGFEEETVVSFIGVREGTDLVLSSDNAIFTVPADQGGTALTDIFAPVSAVQDQIGEEDQNDH